MWLKQTPFESRKYLNWVKRQPCCSCGAPADDPHHAIGLGVGGTGMTAPDSMVMPLCRPCHNRIHGDKEMQGRQWEWIVMTLDKALREDVIKVQ